MKITLPFICSLFMFQIYASPACTEILKDGVFNKSNLHYDESFKNDYKKVLCTSTYDDFSNNNSEIFSIIWEGFQNKVRFSKNKFESWKKKYCKKIQTYGKIEELKTYSYIQLANETTLKKWSECMAQNNNGLSCWVKKDKDDLFQFNLFWMHPTSQLEELLLKTSDTSSLKISNMHSGKTYFQAPLSINDHYKETQVELLATIGGSDQKVCCHSFIPSESIDSFTSKTDLHGLLQKAKTTYALEEDINKKTVGLTASVLIEHFTKTQLLKENSFTLSWYYNPSELTTNKVMISLGQGTPSIYFLEGGAAHLSHRTMKHLFDRLGFRCLDKEGLGKKAGEHRLTYTAK